MRCYVLDDLSTGSIDNIAHLKRQPAFHYTIDTRVQRAARRRARRSRRRHLSPRRRGRRQADRAGAGAHHRNQRARHRSHPATRGEEEETGLHRLDVRGVRQEHVGAVPRGRRSGRWARPPASAGPTPAARRSTSFSRWRTGKRSGCRSIICRFFNTVGPRQTGQYGMVVPTFVRQALAGEPITVFGDGTQTRSFTYVGDVVGALLKLMVEPRAVGRGVQSRQQRRGEHQRPRRAHQGAHRQPLADPRDSLRGGLRGRLRGHAAAGAGSAKISALIGYEPQVGLDEIIRRVVADFRDAGARHYLVAAYNWTSPRQSSP